jgi:hypothetical protein
MLPVAHVLARPCCIASYNGGSTPSQLTSKGLGGTTMGAERIRFLASTCRKPMYATQQECLWVFVLCFVRARTCVPVCLCVYICFMSVCSCEN